MKQHTHRIVIVGGGAGGLELAARLGRRFDSRQIVLIDEAATHVWKPSLHEVAAGTLDIHREGLSYFVLARQCGFTFIQGAMTGLDRDEKSITLAPVHNSAGEQIFPRRSVTYDTLVLAIGSKANFFGTPGAAEHAIALDSTAQAEHFRESMLRELAALYRRRAANHGIEETDTVPVYQVARDGAERLQLDPAARPEEVLNIAIVGGGATGVELASELVEALSSLAYYGIDGLQPERDVKITLIEGADRILSAMPEKLSIKAQRLLHERGITVKTAVRVAGVESDHLVDTEGNHYAANLCVWAAGIEAPSVLSQLGLQTNRNHQIVVNERLESSDPHIFAFGDCAEAPSQDNDRPLPAKAQVAHQQALFLYNVLRARIAGNAEPSRPFRFRDYGSLVSVGHSQGVGNLMGVLSGRNWFVEGLLARLMYMSLHLKHHMAVLGILQTGALALGRLLLRRGTPRVKLH